MVSWDVFFQRFPVFKPWFQRPSRLPLFKSGTYSRRDAQARCPTTTRFTKDVNSASVRPELDTLDLWMINNPTCHNISPISKIIISLMTFNPIVWKVVCHLGVRFFEALTPLTYHELFFKFPGVIFKELKKQQKPLSLSFV